MAYPDRPQGGVAVSTVVRDEHKADQLLQEYWHQRSFGRDHERACRELRVKPARVEKMMERRGLEVPR